MASKTDPVEKTAKASPAQTTGTSFGKKVPMGQRDEVSTGIHSEQTGRDSGYGPAYPPKLPPKITGRTGGPRGGGNTPSKKSRSYTGRGGSR